MDAKELRALIDLDKTSSAKAAARQGQHYYEAKHDIRFYRMFYFDDQGRPQEDTTKSNIKIAHPFFTELVDQQVQYMIGSPDTSFVRSADTDQRLDDKLDRYFGDRFRSQLAMFLTAVVAQGFGYLYAFKDEGGHTQFIAADGLGVIEVRRKSTQSEADHIVRYLTVKVLDGTQYKDVTYAEVWDKEKTTYYVADDSGEFKEDSTEPLNPRPHIIFTREDDKTEDLYYEDLGYIPFFRLDNNPKRMSGLVPIKAIIDDYDFMSCGLSNNLTDLVEGVYVVKGFPGDDITQLVETIKTKKAVGIDSEGDVDIRTIDIPHEARIAKLELNEVNIYRFGMGFNSAQVGDGNITNIVIKSRYALLDLKCNKLEIRLKALLRTLVDIALSEINEELGTAYSTEDVEICFEREIMTNAKDNAEIDKLDAETRVIQLNALMMAAQQLGDEVLAERIADVLGLDWDDIKNNTPLGELEAAQKALEGATVE